MKFKMTAERFYRVMKNCDASAHNTRRILELLKKRVEGAIDETDDVYLCCKVRDLVEKEAKENHESLFSNLFSFSAIMVAIREELGTYYTFSSYVFNQGHPLRSANEARLEFLDILIDGTESY
jgi:hypothetical protein